MSDEVKDEKQTAVAEDANAEPKEADAAGSGAAQKQDGLDDLLKEFDDRRESTQREEVEAKPEPKKQEVDLDTLAALEARLNEAEARTRRKELEGLCSKLSDGTNGDAVDAEAYLIAQAKRNPKLEQAYIRRESNPKAWDAVYEELRKDFGKRYGQKVDKQATESKEAVASAIRSASTAAAPKEFSQREVETMSKDDFDALQRKLGVSPV